MRDTEQLEDLFDLFALKPPDPDGLCYSLDVLKDIDKQVSEHKFLNKQEFMAWKLYKRSMEQIIKHLDTNVFYPKAEFMNWVGVIVTQKKLGPVIQTIIYANANYQSV